METSIKIAKVKFLTLGETNVGKSSLLCRFVENNFKEDLGPTLGVEFKQKEILIDNQPVLIQVWDTAGQERFRTITPSYFQKVDGVLVIFDITDQNSFDNLSYWLNTLSVYTQLDKIVTVIVGNKTDLSSKRVVSAQQGQQLAEKSKLQYFESSAKSNSNVTEIFKYVAQKVLELKGDKLEYIEIQ